MGNHWKTFDYEQWKKENAEFDWEKWERELQAHTDEIFSQNLKDPSSPIKAKSPERCPWKPTPFYNAPGDQIEFYFADDAYHGKWLCPGSELMISETTGEVIGVVIPGIKRMVAKASKEYEEDLKELEEIKVEESAEHEPTTDT